MEFDFLRNFSSPIYILLIVASAFFLWGAITLLRAKKTPQKISRGNKILLWTLSGFLIILFVFFIVNLVSNFLQGGEFFQPKVVEISDEFPPPPSLEEFPPPPSK